MGKTETEASLEAFRKLRAQGQRQPPALVSDGWGGIREALIEVYGEVPPYQGRGRPPIKKQGSSTWQYLQLIKQRDAKGRLLAIIPKAIFGEEQSLLDLFGAHTAYIERSHLTMRSDNRRLCRKTPLLLQVVAPSQGGGNLGRRDVQPVQALEVFALRPQPPS